MVRDTGQSLSSLSFTMEITLSLRTGEVLCHLAFGYVVWCPVLNVWQLLLLLRTTLLGLYYWIWSWAWPYVGGDAKGKGPGSFSNIPSPPCLVMQEQWKRVKVRGLCVHLLWSPVPTWVAFDPKFLQSQASTLGWESSQVANPASNQRTTNDSKTLKSQSLYYNSHPNNKV